jgi:hypothetical protein
MALASTQSTEPNPRAGKASMKSLEGSALLTLLQARFETHRERHPGLGWGRIEARLRAHPEVWPVLARMESTGGEPDVIGHDPERDQFIFCDCSAESPAGRRSLCFDGPAWAARKANKPTGSALEVAAEMGIQILTEDQYRSLQQLGIFDIKTSSWLDTPADVRALGGALFGDRRYGRVFTYHNGAESYYAARGFRGSLRV